MIVNWRTRKVSLVSHDGWAAKKGVKPGDKVGGTENHIFCTFFCTL